jgi:hypothetical protein
VSSPTACSGSDGLGRYEAARDAARQVFERDDVIFGYLAVAELAEAAARTGEVSQVQAALDWLSERTRVTPTAWVLGIEARIRALLSDGQAADGCYRESVERLGGTRVRAELARSHLLYGEWLRRERRRTEAREQLRIAHRMLEEMGMEAFAERARRELRATGETARSISARGRLADRPWAYPRPVCHRAHRPTASSRRDRRQRQRRGRLPCLRPQPRQRLPQHAFAPQGQHGAIYSAHKMIV